MIIEYEKPHGEYSLLSITPNPFNSIIKLNYRIIENGKAQIMIYDITGRKIRILRDGFHNQGFYSVLWDAGIAIIMGAKVKFADVKHGTHNINPEKILMLRNKPNV